MGRLRKDVSGAVFGKLTAVRYDSTRPTVRLKRGKTETIFRYWIFQCECGNTVSRIPNRVRKNKYNMCRECMIGSNTWSWKGIGKIQQEYFRSIYHSAIDRNLEFNITIEHIWSLYLQQDMKCKLSGWDINFNERNFGDKTKTASLDRIDSTKGYVEGNLQWIHKDINKLKKNIPDERFIEICLAVAKNLNA